MHEDEKSQQKRLLLALVAVLLVFGLLHLLVVVLGYDIGLVIPISLAIVAVVAKALDRLL